MTAVVTDGPDLFNYTPPPSEQDIELARVTSKIGLLVLTYLHLVRRHGGTFHAKDLHDFDGPGVAPASADRILRDLRKRGVIDYEVINRRASFYRVLELRG